MAALVGFAVTVFDDRPEFANAERFPDALKTVVFSSLPDCFASLTIEKNASVVIVTRGHAQDKDVLELALKTEAGYIGMIGSLRKRDALYDKLLAQGVTKDDIARVHSPIGLEIAAETPEEIAVSIVAELIEKRAARRG
jgi:xanthine dehydrogenase accessory factor